MNIFDNKKLFVPTWQLKFEIEVGKFVDELWIGDYIDNNDIKFSIEYDNIVLLDSKTKKIQGSHCFNIVDDKENTHHNLVVYNWSELSPGTLIKCKVFVEDVDIGYIFINSRCYHLYDGELNYGSEYFGQPGIQIVTIRTPIYRWLLDNKHHIFSKLKQEYQIALA